MLDFLVNESYCIGMQSNESNTLLKDRKQTYAEAWMYYLTGKFAMSEIADALELDINTLSTFAMRHGWKAARQKIWDKAGSGLKKALADRIEKARIAHLNFALDQLDETAEVIGSMKVGEEDPHGKPNKETGEKPKVTVERKLSLTRQQHEIATSVLKLDDDKNEDETALGFQILIGLQTNTQPVNSEASTGILRSNNALPDVVHEADFTLLTGNPAEAEALPAAPGVEEMTDAEPTPKPTHTKGATILHKDKPPTFLKPMPVKVF